MFPTPNSTQTPKPCAQIPHSPRSARDTAANERANYEHDNSSHHPDYEPYKSPSMSSSGDSSVMTPMSSIELEKSNAALPQAPKRSPRDPEKAMYDPRNDSHQPRNTGDSASLSYSEDDGDDNGRRRQEERAVKIVLFLAGPCVMLSALNTAWACISLVITLLTQPVRFCAKRPTFAQQLAGLLGPALNLQLRCIYTPLAPHADEDSSYHTGMLVAVHMLSPFLSLGVMVVSWVLAAFWLASAVVGDPAGLDKRDDGRDTVLWLRGWWEGWLLRGVKEQ